MHEREVLKMFNVKLDNCGGETGKVQTEVRLCDITEIQLPFIINKAREAFRSIETIDNETGEIVYTFYIADSFYMPMSTEGEVLDEIYQIIGGM
jgi:hypothetical protein